MIMQGASLSGKITAAGSLVGSISRTVEHIGSTVQPLSVTENGKYNVPKGVAGFNPVEVAVPIRYDEGYDNGYTAGEAAGKEALTALDDLIDQSGVLDTTEGTATEKVEQLIDLVEQNELPDWDDDSPIIASGEGATSRCVWELTEKGTMRWRIDPNGTGSGTYAVTAGWSNTITTKAMPFEYMEVASKVRQIDVGEGLTNFYMGFAINCERIRVKETLKNYNTVNFASLKEIEHNGTEALLFNGCLSIERIILSDSHTKLNNYFAQNCLNLKEINLDNVVNYRSYCLADTPLLKIPIIFNAGLTNIDSNAFVRCAVTSITFQTPTGELPTIASNAFTNNNYLTEVNLYDGWSMDLYVQEHQLTQASLHDIAEKYADMTGKTAPILRLGARNIAKMDEEHLAMLNNKNIEYS